MTANLKTVGTDVLFHYVLRLADDALVNGHRLSEWCGHAPMLEEDLALANMALDLIGQSRALYSYASEVEGRGRDEDSLAYLRDVASYGNLLIVELPNGDFARTIVRQFLVSAFMRPFWEALNSSGDAVLAGIAAKATKEVAYHLRHCGEWTIRLGDGTDESHRRIRQALDDLWPFTGEMFEVDGIARAMIDCGSAPDPASIRSIWTSTLDGVLAQATLKRPNGGWMQTGGRSGRQSEHLGHILAQLQYMPRTYPGARW